MWYLCVSRPRTEDPALRRVWALEEQPDVADLLALLPWLDSR